MWTIGLIAVFIAVVNIFVLLFFTVIEAISVSRKKIDTGVSKSRAEIRNEKINKILRRF